MLGFIANSCSQNNSEVCFSSLNISGVKNTNIEEGTKTRVYLTVDILKQCLIRFKMIYIYIQPKR